MCLLEITTRTLILFHAHYTRGLNETMYVNLFDTAEGHELDISREMIDSGFAEEADFKLTQPLNINFPLELPGWRLRDLGTGARCCLGQIEMVCWSSGRELWRSGTSCVGTICFGIRVSAHSEFYTSHFVIHLNSSYIAGIKPLFAKWDFLARAEFLLFCLVPPESRELIRPKENSVCSGYYAYLEPSFCKLDLLHERCNESFSMFDVKFVQVLQFFSSAHPLVNFQWNQKKKVWRQILRIMHSGIREWSLQC